VQLEPTPQLSLCILATYDDGALHAADVVLINHLYSVVCDSRRHAGGACWPPRTGECDAIVTGDQNLLVLDPFHGIRVLTPAGFWKWDSANDDH
jgi:hypothetical protein